MDGGESKIPSIAYNNNIYTMVYKSFPINILKKQVCTSINSFPLLLVSIRKLYIVRLDCYFNHFIREVIKKIMEKVNMELTDIAKPRLPPGTEVVFPYYGRGVEDMGRKNGFKTLRHFTMALGTVQEVNQLGQVLIYHAGGIYNRKISDVYLPDEIKDRLFEDPAFVVKGMHDISVEVST